MPKIPGNTWDNTHEAYRQGFVEGAAAARAESTAEKAARHPADPWRHRSRGMRCRSCMFFVPKAHDGFSAVARGDERGNLGRCRRHAPTMSGFPAVFQEDWCGDHKLDETKP